MTSTQFVEYSGRGLWAYDVALGVFLKHLIDAAESSKATQDQWLADAVVAWRRVACISDFALVIDKNWTVDQVDTFVRLAERACEALATRDAIPAQEIESWPVFDALHLSARGASEVRTAPVIELGQAVVGLVRGELPEPPRGRRWFYGTPTGRSIL